MEVTRRWFGLTALCGALLPAVPVLAIAPLGSDPGVFDDRIVFGQSAALKGSAAALGLGMRDGILAAFHEANAAGGVYGRKLDLISYNDDYEPELAIAKTNRLLGEDRVFALIGEVGTPTSKAVQPITTEHGVPFIGPFTGADFLRDPSLTNVINIRASYGQETEAWIEHLTTDLGLSLIAILYQTTHSAVPASRGSKGLLRNEAWVLSRKVPTCEARTPLSEPC
jgi:branched-chain amino acid transport system substrate-binding protein